MHLYEILEKAEGEAISEEEALWLFMNVTSYKHMYDLFRTAARVRDREAGTTIKIVDSVGSIRSCKTNPACTYCSRSAGKPSWDYALSSAQLLEAAELVERSGGRVIHAFGGADLQGDGSDIVEIVKALRNETRLDIIVSSGPDFSLDNLKLLKRSGLKEIGCAVETINGKIYETVKPGDSLVVRKKLIQSIDRVGLKLYTVLMVGLGGCEDYVHLMHHLKSVKNLSCLTMPGC